MTQHPPPAAASRLTRRLTGFACATPVLVAALGTSVLLGWLVENRLLKSWVPGLVAMNPITAVAFLLASAAAWFSLAEKRPWARSLARILVGFVLLIALLRLIGYVGPWDLGIDRVLFAVQLEAEPRPNRMAPNTALAFLLVGASILALNSREPAGRRAARIGLVLILAISLVTICGYGYTAHQLARVADSIPMALHTAVGFGLLASGLLCARPEEGIMGELTSDAVGGRIARALLPGVLGVPLALGWLRVAGERAGLYGTEVGVALHVTAWIVVLIGLLCWQARSLNRADAERLRNEERIAGLNRELRVRTNELEALNSELEAFSYSISHDLRAPLRSITSFSQALLEDCSDRLDAQGRDYLERVVGAGRRMALLIDDILALSRVTRKELRLEPVDLTMAAREVVDELRGGEPERLVDVQIEPGMKAVGDPQLLRVVLQNLLGNAWKFTGNTAGAQIVLETYDGGNGSVRKPVYRVRDNGAGFDMQYADKLFGVFQRLHSDTEFPGTGVGLATVQRIVHRHGGRVWAESSVGHGAAFYFSL